MNQKDFAVEEDHNRGQPSSNMKGLSELEVCLQQLIMLYTFQLAEPTQIVTLTLVPGLIDNLCLN
jgi:hypothetical protein